MARSAEVRTIDDQTRPFGGDGDERMLECLSKSDTVHGDGTSYHISANIEKACLYAGYYSSIGAAP